MTRIAAICSGALLGLSMALAGCGARGQSNPAEGAPPAAQVESEADPNIFHADHPERFPLATAGQYNAAVELKATGVVTADVSRTVPVISLASGRVVEIRARLGDRVTKGQLLMRVHSADIAAAFADYRHARADETLANAQFDRAKLLFDKGAIAAKDLEVAEDAEAKAKVDVETAVERLKVLGADVNNPSPLVNIVAPVSGVITEQNVTAASGVKSLDNSPNLFTIADLSNVWIVCDIYENDLAGVRVGEFADVRLNAFPGKVFKGRIGNIGPILDPTLRTAKVRLEIANPGMMRQGMFVTATFHGATQQSHAAVPATAILHLHDRDWVYVPAGSGVFRRVEVAGGRMLPGNMQEILSGVAPGASVVANALVLQNTAEQ